jgi:hypothetical protein
MWALLPRSQMAVLAIIVFLASSIACGAAVSRPRLITTRRMMMASAAKVEARHGKGGEDQSANWMVSWVTASCSNEMRSIH